MCNYIFFRCFHSAITKKEAITSDMTHILFVRPSVHVEKFDYHRTGIGKILYTGVLLKYAEAFEFWSTTDKVTVG
jgi:hypothetical protein